MAKEKKNVENENEEIENGQKKEDNEIEANTNEEVVEKVEIKDLISAEKEKYLRLVAEYDNFRKRSAKEKLETYTDATVKIVSEFIPLYDNFERALEVKTDDEMFKKGIEMIYNQFSEALKKLNVEVINPLGEQFNPDCAQAINQVEDENYGENVVCQVFQKGYKVNDKVIRYAMVVVANP